MKLSTQNLFNQISQKAVDFLNYKSFGSEDLIDKSIDFNNKLYTYQNIKEWVRGHKNSMSKIIKNYLT